jgi:DNA-binding MarR family transcriptional regulator
MNYEFRVSSWMMKELELSGNELIVFAVLYDYTGSAVGEYSLGYNFLVELTNASKPTVIRSVKELERKGYITKTKKSIEGEVYASFKTIVGGEYDEHDKS